MELIKQIKEAEKQAQGLLEETGVLSDSRRTASAALLQEATTALETAGEAADAAYIQAPGRMALKKAEIALGEAWGLHDRGSYEEADHKARQVMVDIFRVLPDDSELTTEYRRKLSLALY